MVVQVLAVVDGDDARRAASDVDDRHARILRHHPHRARCAESVGYVGVDDAPVRHHRDRLSAMSRGKRVHLVGDPAAERGIALSIRNAVPCSLRNPREKLGIALRGAPAKFTSTPVAQAHFLQFRVNFHWQAVVSGNVACGVKRPAEVAGIDRPKRGLGESTTDCRSLHHPIVVQRRIGAFR